MTWESLMELLAREFRKLRSVPVVNFGFASQPVLNANDLRDEELRVAERVDAIVHDFARTRRWPALDERERFFLRERLRFAYEYAAMAEISAKRAVSIASRPQIWNEQRRLLEWLLIDVWRSSGVRNWLEPFYVITGSRSPADPAWQINISE